MPALTSFTGNEFIDSLSFSQESWTLDRMRTLSKKMHLSPERLKCVHVTGTNGKGSVTACCESILRQAGFKTGMYTSPHLVSPTERIKVNGKNMSEKAFGELAQEVEQTARKLPHKQQPSFFEALTAMAFLHFEREAVDYATIEVGLGGRLDATNIVLPQAAVITNVSLEHTTYLGNTVEKIAREKSGIIKPGTLVATGCTTQALEVVRKTCKTNNARLFQISEKQIKKIDCNDKRTRFSFQKEDCETSLLGRHQALNAALAIKAIQLLNLKGAQIPKEAVHKGLQTVVWRGRLDVVSRKPLIVLDGAHNPAAATALSQAVNEIWPEKTKTLVLGILKDKDLQGILERFAEMNPKTIIASQSHTSRAMQAQLLATAAASAMPKTEIRLQEDLRKALEQATKTRTKEELFLVTGSLYTVGEAMKILRLKT